MQAIIKIVQFLRKRPSDKTIRILRILFACIYAGILICFKDVYILVFWNAFGLSQDVWIYILAIFGIFPFIMGIFPICIFQKKYIRRIQVLFAVFLFYLSFFGIQDIKNTEVSEEKKTDEIMLEDIYNSEDSSGTPVSEILFLLAFFPLVLGITGKGIPSYCMKYKEKIQRIRV